MSNLLTNARVHTPPGVTVTTGITRHRSGPDGPYAELTVQDDGPDIDADVLPRLFERFVRADKSRTNGAGNGLGLAIVSSIVKAHHGSVTAESGRRSHRISGADSDDRKSGPGYRVKESAGNPAKPQMWQVAP